MKALLKRMLKPFYRATKKVLRPIATRVRGPLSRMLYPPEFEAVFRNLEQITSNLKGQLDQSDQLLLAMFQTLNLPPAQPSIAAAPMAANLGDGRILTKHPLAAFVTVDATERRDTPRILLQQYQSHVTEAFRRLVRPGDCCVDLGAGIGFHTLTLATLAGRTANGFAIELETRRFAFLDDNLISNELIPAMSSFHAEGAEVAADWLRRCLAERGKAPDFVRCGPGFDQIMAGNDLRGWSAAGARLFLSTSHGVSTAKLLAADGCLFWMVAPDGSLFRTELAAIEERGRLSEVHFLAARSLV